jgi:23S rRNA (adenine2503-C2)-methyltransferase
MKLDLLGLTSDQLVLSAKERLPKGAGIARDIFREAHQAGRFEPEAHGVSKVAASGWREHFELRLPDVVRTIQEPTAFGDTVKAVLRTHDGLEIECVRIPMANDQSTLCLSSQIGCKMGCKFCETGRMGLLRDLSAGEIVSQVVVAQSMLGWGAKNLVFMGMGEALDNVENLIQALLILNDKRGLGFSQQRITVCTVGHAEGLRRLRELGWKRLNLAFSLNAAIDDKRAALMPVHRKTPLEETIAALNEYPLRRNFTWAVNYCLMPGLNDSREDARAVAGVVERLGRVLLNLIPYNPGTDALTRAPTEQEIAGFIAWLEEGGVPVRRRKTKGRSVMAACGQLGNVELRRSRLRVTQ